MIGGRATGLFIIFIAVCFALRPLNLKLKDSPSLVPKPGPPAANETVIVEQVVNVEKTAIVVSISSLSPMGQQQRQFARDTWMQALNRSSPYSVSQPMRKAYSVWFAVPQLPGALANNTAALSTEGKVYGDILEINVSNSSAKSSRWDVYGALIRWVRVAYFQHFDYLVLTRDTSFVSISNLDEYLSSKSKGKLFYSGFVNSFETAFTGYGHDQYAPFVVDGTIVLSRESVELLAREFDLIKELPRADATLGSFFMTFDEAKPLHNNSFVASVQNVYFPLQYPIIINKCPKPMMIALSLPGLDANGKPLPPAPVPAQTNIATTQISVDPIPTGPEPACGDFPGSDCSMDALRAINEMPR